MADITADKVKALGFLLLDLADMRARIATAPDIMVSIDFSEGKNLPGHQVAASTAQIEHGLGMMCETIRDGLAKDQVAAIVDNPIEKEAELMLLLAEQLNDRLKNPADDRRTTDFSGALGAKPNSDAFVVGLASTLLSVGEQRARLAHSVMTLLVGQGAEADEETRDLILRAQNASLALEELARKTQNRVDARDAEGLLRRPLSAEQTHTLLQAKQLADQIQAKIVTAAGRGETRQ